MARKLRLRGMPLVFGLLFALPQAARAGCSVTQGDFDASGREDVRILGDAGPQTIEILDGQSTYQVRVDCNGDGDFTDPGDIDTGVLPFDIETFDIQGKGKDDIRYVVAAPFSGASKDILVSLGPAGTGFNRLQVNGSFPVQANSSIVLDVLGSSGFDIVFAGFGEVVGSSIVIRGDLGAGHDLALFEDNTERDGTVVTRDIDLGTGGDSFLVQTANTYRSTVLTNVSGSPSGDSFAWFGGGQILSGRDLTNASLFGGADRVETRVYPGQFAVQGSDSTLALRVRGGDGNDTFSFDDGDGSRGTTNGGLIDVDFSGGAGNDVATWDWSGPIGGNGTTRIRLNGGDGNDLLISAVNLDSSATTPSLDFLLQGGRGSDTLFWSVLDASGAASYQPLGASLGDGGADEDTCIFFGNGLHESLSCESGS